MTCRRVPSLGIILLIAIYCTEFRDNRYVEDACKGMRQAVVGLIAAPVCGLAGGMKWWKLAAAAVSAIVVWLLDVSPIWFIVIGALVGIGHAFCDKRGLIPEDRAAKEDEARKHDKEEETE